MRRLSVFVLLVSSAVSVGDEDYSRLLLADPDLAGWIVTDCEVELVDGVLELQSGNGFVRSDHKYADFILEWECKALADDDWDSGVYFRSELPVAPRPWPRRYQVNLRKGEEGDLVRNPDAKGAEHYLPGEWNRFHLKVVGNVAELQINGKRAWKTDAIEPTEGYVGLQAEVPQGGRFLFRNIRLTELGFRSLFNGKDLTHWEGAAGDASTCWEVEDGMLVCNGQKGTWLRSLEQFGDFNLRLEYRLKPGGNSGVYVRVPKDGNHHGEGAGTEIQILDDHAERYAELKPYQYSASVYAVVPAEPRVCKPAGEWNTLEIDVRGPDYKITHNGVVVVDADAKSVPELKQRLTSGYLGLQNHSEHVWFRNIRIKAD